MKHTYALCPTRKELVWLENPPVKPGIEEIEYFGIDKCNEDYKQALTQAIADAQVVKEGREEIIKLIKIREVNNLNDEWPIKLKPGTLYEVEIEGEMELAGWQCRLLGQSVWDDSFCSERDREKFRRYGFEYRQVCRLIPEPK